MPPEGLVGRIKERNDLVMELSPILLGSPVSSVFVYGTPGTGKTALTMQISEELRKEAKKQKGVAEEDFVLLTEGEGRNF